MFEPMPSSPEDFADYIKAQTEKWAKVIREQKLSSTLTSTPRPRQAMRSRAPPQEPKRGAPRHGDGEARREAPPHADRLGEVMHAEKSETKTDERGLRMGEDRTRRLAAGARMHDHREASHYDRKHRERAGGE